MQTVIERFDQRHESLHASLYMGLEEETCRPANREGRQNPASAPHNGAEQDVIIARGQKRAKHDSGRGSGPIIGNAQIHAASSRDADIHPIREM
ncbi:MAG: hypothetical protein AB7D33_14290 [Sphingobium sp.]